MIRAREVRTIGADGDQLGILPLERALAIAEEQNLDLVEVAPHARPPVCKIMDYGRYKYQQAKKAQEAKKRQTVIQVKEVKVRPKTEEHDFQVKLKKVREFLAGGNKVKVTVMFRGREVTLPQKGLEQLQKMVESLGEEVRVESPPKREGRTMFMMLAPATKPQTKQT
ncbi:MAG: translation initiation factor IF-3 [Deferrisomatales bacterium]